MPKDDKSASRTSRHFIRTDSSFFAKSLVVVVLKDILVLQNRQREAQNLFREEEKAFGSDPRLDPSFGDVDVASTACEATKIRKPE